jgi:flagellum-specific peptidoglycan hydrolase FlgJ
MLHRVPTYANHGLFKCNTAEGQAAILRMAGYATDPGYPQKLMKLVNEYNLKQYDDV